MIQIIQNDNSYIKNTLENEDVKDSIENSIMDLTEVISYTNIVDCPTQVTCFVHSDVYICHNTKVGNRKKHRYGQFANTSMVREGQKNI